mgnify:CR=1 FL=1
MKKSIQTIDPTRQYFCKTQIWSVVEMLHTICVSVTMQPYFSDQTRAGIMGVSGRFGAVWSIVHTRQTLLLLARPPLETVGCVDGSVHWSKEIWRERRPTIQALFLSRTRRWRSVDPLCGPTLTQHVAKIPDCKQKGVAHFNFGFFRY